jgi:hypothetical protein
MSWWSSQQIWRRAGMNTTRCLIGCSLGDFGALFAMQHSGVALSMPTTMAIAMTCGLGTSFALETAILKYQEDMSLKVAAETAFNMSIVSMLAMETAENVTDLYLTGGLFEPDKPYWWAALGVSLGAGFLTPLPYNYYRLKRHGRSCH